MNTGSVLILMSSVCLFGCMSVWVTVYTITPKIMGQSTCNLNTLKYMKIARQWALSDQGQGQGRTFDFFLHLPQYKLLGLTSLWIKGRKL